ncbi:MAG: hypothetical protein SGILL_002433 [Bacillariaceae sp.]
MVACDKGNVVCLEYMLEKFAAIEKTKEPPRLKRAKRNKLKTLLGNPLLDVSTTNHNSAMHHAAMAGCTQAICILHRIQTYLRMDEKHCQDVVQEKENQDHETVGSVSQNSRGTPQTVPMFILFASARNNHNDTPLMMATQSASALEFVETWYQLAMKEQESVDESEGEKSLRTLLQAKNDSGDSCLSLACSHGRLNLVKFLVGHEEENDQQGTGETMIQSTECKVDVTAEELAKCKTSFQRMEQALNNNPKLKKEYQSQRNNVEACLKLLEARLLFLSEQATRELLEQEDDKPAANESPKHKGKKKKKSKKKAPASITTSSNVWDNVAQSEASKEVDVMILKTLPDGTRAVQVQGKPDVSTEHNALLSGVNSTVPSLDASEMLRERFRGISNEEVDAVMSALCLDVQCLLYSDHGMALNLSAAQLDAVQQILEKQLESVKKARDIQQRMHETSASSGDGNADQK